MGKVGALHKRPDFCRRPGEICPHERLEIRNGKSVFATAYVSCGPQRRAARRFNIRL